MRGLKIGRGYVVTSTLVVRAKLFTHVRLQFCLFSLFSFPRLNAAWMEGAVVRCPEGNWRFRSTSIGWDGREDVSCQDEDVAAI